MTVIWSFVTLPLTLLIDAVFGYIDTSEEIHSLITDLVQRMMYINRGPQREGKKYIKEQESGSSQNSSYGHSLQYYYTAVSSLGHGLPKFISVGYVDGIEITRYSSDTGQTRPVAPWMQKVEDHEYWEKETWNGKHAEYVNKRNVAIAMYRFNQTEGFHSFQEMYGCELRDDGSTRGFWQFGYDGKDFLVLDTERWVYSALTDQAQVSAQKWNIPEQRAGKRAKDYLETDCIDWLKKYLEYGKEELERRVRPEVKVSGRQSDNVTKLHCQVYGFYPRDVDVNWKKNGTDFPSDEAKQILPNTDGTYQIRVTVTVAPEEGASYACHVEHSSLNEPLITMWDTEVKDRSSSPWHIIITAIIIIGLVVLAVLIVFYKRRVPESSTPAVRYIRSAGQEV